MGEEEIKKGSRNNADDRRRIRETRAHAVEIDRLTRELEPDDEDQQPEEEKTLVTFGAEVKALGEGRVAGYLVRFSTANDPDLTGDFFTKDTDFDITDGARASVYYHHGLDAKMGRRKLGAGELRVDDVGVWIEAQLSERDAYEKAVYEMAKAGKLGWSSGTASHLVDRESAGKANRITRWPLGLDASLTPTPAEPRNAAVVPLKSLTAPDVFTGVETPETEGEPEAVGDTAGSEVTGGNVKSTQPMESTVTGAKMEITEEQLKEYGERAAMKALESFKASLPVVNQPGVSVTHDEADNKFTSIAEQCAAVKSYKVSMGRKVDPRLTRLDAMKAPLGASEGVDVDGAFLLEPTLAAEVIKPVHEEGPFSRAVRRLPVGSNSNYGYINGVNETSRATGSRWGGIRGYWLAEAGTPTASKPAFRRINWELKKMGVLVYSTDELLADVSQFSAIVRQSAAEELAFMVNDDIMNGGGGAHLNGFMSSGALITVAKENGQAADTIVNENLMKMWARLDSRSKARASWYINTDCNPQLDQLVLSSAMNALEPRFVTYDAQGTLRIKGRPVVETEFNATLGDLGDIVLADLSEYLFWEKGGVESASSIHVQFLTDETVFRFLYRCDGQTSTASPLTPYKGSNTVSSFVALAAR